MKTTVRTIVNLPDNTAHIQRLYDDGISFRMTEEWLTDPAEIADFILTMKSHGGKEIHQVSYIRDDDRLPHFEVVYEYTT